MSQVTQALRLASRNLLRQRRRVVIALITICGGVIAYLLAGGFIHWIFHSMREATIHAQLGHIQITRPGYFAQGISDPYQYLLPPDSEMRTIRELDGVMAVAPRLAFNGLISLNDATISFLGEGVAPDLEAPIAKAITIVAGKDLTESPPASAILGEGLAANLGASPGDKVVLLATTSAGGLNAVEVTIAGLFATSTKAYDDTFIRVPIEIARSLMRVEAATSWVLLLDRTDATMERTQALRATLPSEQYEVTPWSDLADFYKKTVELFSRQVSIVRILIALIVILSISNTLAMAVIERTTEIGTSLAIGVKRRDILSSFIMEGALLGLAGGCIGVGGGIALAEIISAIGIPMPPPPGMARGFIGEIVISPALALDAFLLAFLTTLFASILPAWKAASMNIVDALRHQR